MAKYNIFMVKLGNPQIGIEGQFSTTLKGFFDQVIRSNAALNRRFGEGADVQWMARCPETAPHELLVYVVSSGMDSIVNSLPGLSGQPANLGDDGLTAWTNTLTASEIYVSRFGGDASMLAKLAFHEAMHNKTHQGSGLHNGGGLAASPLLAGSQLTRANIQIMAGALGRARAQWTGGCSAYNDPLRGL
jgi:hypothetical protein